MKSFRIKGIKAFQDSTNIEIKPITIFVGENSSGKSSLLRFIPVLAQTFQEDVITPLLFFGKMIDYGNYESVSYNSEGKSLEFEFVIDNFFNKSNLFRMMPLGLNLERKDLIRDIMKEDLILNIKLLKFNKKINIEKFSVSKNSGDSIFSISFIEKNKYKVDSQIFKGIETIKNVPIDFNKFIPRIKYRFLDEIFEKLILEKYEGIDIEKILNFSYKKRRIRDEEGIESILTDKEKQAVEEVEKFEFQFEIIDRLLEYIERYCHDYSSDITYIGPFRKDPERVYRESESIYKNVGVKGENTGFVLKQSYNEQNELLGKVSNWLSKSLDISLGIKEVYKNNLFEIVIKGNQSYEANIIDVGYGISQVLPIISQIYKEKDQEEERYYRFKIRNGLKTFLVEQPELHLHPKAQAQLADLFVEKAIEDKNNRIILETHSEHLIRKLQVLVADPKVEINKDDIAIYYVYRDKGEGAKVQQMFLNNKGQFSEEWPSGFFDKSSQLTDELLGFLFGDL